MAGSLLSMVASEYGDRPNLLDLLKEPVLAVQEFYLLAGRAFRNIFRSPHYSDDICCRWIPSAWAAC